MTKQDYALQAIEKGFAVFPVVWTDEDGVCSCGNEDCKHRGKHPLPGSSGFKDATRDTMQVERWWKENPEANYGIHPGEKFLVVDLDVKDSKNVNGIRTFAQYLGMDEMDVLDLTFTVETPTGGLHLYFKTDIPYSDKLGIMNGVDVRAQVGYVVGWGSVIGRKAYEVVTDIPLSNVPDKLAILLGSIRKKSESLVSVHEPDDPGSIKDAISFLKRRAPAIEYHGGDNQTYTTAAQVKDFNISEEKCYELMMLVYNPRCQPPWSESEMRRIVTNAYGYGKDVPGSKSSNDMDRFLGIDDGAVDISEILEKDKNDRFARFRANFYSGDKSRQLERNYDFLAYGFIPAQGYTALLADRGVGKSTVALDFCLHLVNEKEWHGIKLAEGWSVVYVVGEDMEGIIMRQNAWCKKHGIKSLPDERWNVMDMKIDITNEEEVVDFAEFLREKYAKGSKIVFVLDTWQRMSSGAEGGQNDDVSMQKSVAHAEWLARTFNGPAIIAFHPPKNNKGTISGSGILENNSHAIINITQDLGNRRIEPIRIKGCELGEALIVKFEKVYYDGVNNLGIKNSGPVPKCIGGQGGVQSEEMKIRTDALLQVLAEVLAWTEKADTFTYNRASEVIRTLPRTSKEGDDEHFGQWHDRLEKAGWVFENPGKTSQESKTRTYAAIRQALPESTQGVDVPGRGLVLFTVKGERNNAFIKVRKSIEQIDEETGEITDLNDEVEFE